MTSLESSLREENTIVSNNANWVSVQMAESRDESLSVVLLELMEARAVQNTTQYCIHVEWLLVIDWNDSIEVLFIEEWFGWLNTVSCVLDEGIIAEAKVLDNRSSYLEGMLLIVGEMITHTRLRAVKIGTSQLLICYNFTCGSLNERWTTEEDCTLVLYHDDFI